jgi:glycosyltransferase involved in cell wall biosynthesis
VHCRVIGEGEERAALLEYGLDIPGWTADVRPHLAWADVLAVPSRWEGFGLVVVEAMASGVPVVASRVDGLDEVVGDAGILVPPDEPGALASALGRVLEDRELRAELAAAGIRRSRLFGVDTMVAAYEQLYSDVLSET